MKVLSNTMKWLDVGRVTSGGMVASIQGSTSTGAHKQMCMSLVIDCTLRSGTVARISTDKGEITLPYSSFFYDAASCRWAPVKRLRVGRLLSFGMSVEPQPDTSAEAYMLGYLAGMTEGDGTARWLPIEGATPRPEDPRRQVWWRVALSDTEPLERLSHYAERITGVAVPVRPFDSGSPLTKLPMYKVEARAKDVLASLSNAIMTANRQDSLYRKGYIAGVFDAEGSYSDIIRISV